jgi:hypothetical protein
MLERDALACTHPSTERAEVLAITGKTSSR